MRLVAKFVKKALQGYIDTKWYQYYTIPILESEVLVNLVSVEH